MSDNVVLNIPTTTGATIATDDISGVQHQLVKQEFGVDGVATMVSAANPLPVTDAAAEASLVSILAKLSDDPATQTTLAAILAKIITAPSTEAKQDAANALLTTIAAIAQPLTDTQLRATPVPVSGTVTTGGLTDTQLRATPVPVSGTIAVSTALNLEATQLLVKAKTDNLDVALSTRLKAADTLAAVTLISDVRQATAGNLNMTEASAAAIKTAVEVIDNFISGARGLVTEDNSAAILAKIIAAPATEAKQDTGNTSLTTIAGKDFATQTTIAAFYAALGLAQGASGNSTLGPMVQGLVNDVPSSYLAGYVQPLSLTAEGRLRVSVVNADINRIWQNTFSNPFFEDDLYPVKNNFFNT